MPVSEYKTGTSVSQWRVEQQEQTWAACWGSEPKQGTWRAKETRTTSDTANESGGEASNANSKPWSHNSNEYLENNISILYVKHNK